MAFTSGFENDIFISYCHFDNAAPRSEQGWVDRFHEELESWLVRRFGPKKLSIWRDKKLNGLDLFGNPLVIPPIELVKKGMAAVKKYFEFWGNSQSFIV